MGISFEISDEEYNDDADEGQSIGGAINTTPPEDPDEPITPSPPDAPKRPQVDEDEQSDPAGT
jgi:hypothetical protein